MTYVFFGAFAASFLALLWMAKRLSDAGAYKQALLVVLMGTLGWCMPVFIQIFVLAAFLTIAVQWWEDTKPALIAWLVAVVATFAAGQMVGGAQEMIQDLNPTQAPAEVTTETSETPEPSFDYPATP